MNKKKKKFTYHMYSKEIADQYGTKAATLLYHFGFWYEKVLSEDHQYFEGEYWVRMKLDVLQGYFSYWSKDQLRRIIKKMCELSLLKKGEFNDKRSDRTNWYTLTERSKELLFREGGEIADSRGGEIAGSTEGEIAYSIYKEEDKTKEYTYGSAYAFLEKYNPIELESWVMQNRREIGDFDSFLEFYEIKVEQEELPFRYHTLFGRLKQLKYNWKGYKNQQTRDHEVEVLKMRPTIH